LRTWTFAEIKEKVLADLDLQGEDFVDDDEMMGYANDAIDEAEAQIHNLNEDYFLTSDAVSLELSEDEYDLPTDIYGAKIRAVHYDDGTDCYDVKRIKLKDIPNVQTQDPYRWIYKNESGHGKFKIYPVSRVTSSTAMTRWYIRNANRLTASDSVCDIPEFARFVIDFVKVQCAVKELNPQLAFYKQQLEESRALMIQTLTEMVPDEDNDIEKDLSHYDDMA
jgi:hypothetical protein